VLNDAILATDLPSPLSEEAAYIGRLKERPFLQTGYGGGAGGI
jgi:hypothetical protein